jgi:molybdenum cofactor synthesis domain-containing protein
MGCHFASIGKDHIGQKAFVAADQRGADKGGLKLHNVGLYLARSGDKIGAKMANPTAAFLVIGDEILSGRTHDKNIGFLAERLTEAAIDLREVRVVDDDHDNIIRAVQELSARWDHVFTSGGIGPTHDDITADAMAAAFEASIDVRDDARALLEAHTKRNGVELNEARLRMARIPAGAVLIDNPVSIAPGFTIGNVHVMAGVPAVFQAMVSSVLSGLSGGVPLLSRTLRIDRPEGEIAGPLGVLAARHNEVSIGSYPFILQGKFGANIVFRCTEAPLLDAAISDLSTLFPEGREL